MAAVIITIADAVAAELNEKEWSLPFTATRVYVPVHELRDLSTLTVTVVPKSLKPTLLSRSGANLYDYLIDIGIQQLIGQGQMTDAQINSAADPLMALAEEIVSEFFLENLVVPGLVPLPKCIDAENTPIYHPQDIDEKRVFTTVITLNYRQGR